MDHRKKKQLSCVKLCSFFKEGKCAFDGDVCWFRHIEIKTTKISPIPQNLKEYNCGICGKVFHEKKDFMIHRKIGQSNQVSECITNKNGWCNIGEKDCWFRYLKLISNNESEKSKESAIETSEMLNRLFDITEAFGERMYQVENKI